MIKIDDLYDEATKEDVIIVDENLKSSEAISICDEGLCLVAIDSRKVKNSADRLVKTAHELGHCETGAFYNQYSNYNVVSKQEYIADKWAVQKLIPADELLSAVSEGYTEAWQLADYFGVTEDFVHKAYKIYKAMSVLD